VLFIIQVYFGSELSLFLETVDHRVLDFYIEVISTFNLCSSIKNCPSDRRVSAADVVCRIAKWRDCSN
jgi:hypothetical protein